MFPHSFYKVVHLLGIVTLFTAMGGSVLHALNGGTKQSNAGRGLVAALHGTSLLLILIGGVLGLALGSLALPIVSEASGGMIQLPPIGSRSWGMGIALMIAVGAIVGILPAWRAMRLRVVDALAGR